METRLQKMGTDVPGGAKLLHTEPGTFRTEKILHRHFAAHRLRGEWFSKAPELLAYIEQRKGLGLADDVAQFEAAITHAS